MEKACQMNCRFRVSLILSMVFLLTIPNHVTANDVEDPKTIYKEAKTAYESGDCMTAILKFQLLQKMTQDKREENQEFFKLIDSKITNCRIKGIFESASSKASSKALEVDPEIKGWLKFEPAIGEDAIQLPIQR